jgi:PPOX class probable F420-dependent enzyme
VVFATGADTLKGKALRRDAGVAMCVDDEAPPFAFVLIEGTAELSEAPGPLLEWATRIGCRYMGAELAEAYGTRNAVPGELLVRVAPTHVVARAEIAD